MRNKFLVCLFSLFIISISICNIALKDSEISKSERRKLQTFPKANIENILNGNFFSKFDNYTNDQFVKRDEFRKIKSFVSKNILMNKDNNGLYVIDDHIFKMEYPYNKDGLMKTINKINNVYNNYLENNNVYYAIIPDKNYYVNDNYLKLDYNDMIKTINNNFDFKYINILKDLKLSDYYYTDPHIKQNCFNDVVKTLINGMNNEYFDVYNYENKFNNFYGSYYSQLGLSNKSDEMVYLTNKYINSATVTYLENKNLHTVYNLSKYNGMDPYDIFLDGATALVNIVNNEASSDKELIIFRDSFGSSIAPLLIPYYKKITLVDLRYLSSNLLSNYIEFNNQDVLFLYSTLIYNTNILK